MKTVVHVAAVEYGVRTLLLPQLEELQRQGLAVRVACAPEKAEFHEDLSPFAPLALTFSRTGHPGKVARALRDFVRFLWAERPAAVHLHSPAAALPVRSIPRSLLPPDLKLLYTVHGFSHQWDPPVSGKDRALEVAERILSRRTDALLFQSGEDLAHARERKYAGRLSFLGNGVEDLWFDIPLPQPSRRPFRVLFVGRLVREKGVLELIEALRLVPEVRLSFAGAEISSERTGVASAAMAAIESAGLSDRVEFLGHVEKASMPRTVAAHDALVLPSYREGMPRSLIEGMAAGRPCVATRIRGCREVVEDGANGYLVAPRDSHGLASALRRLATSSADDFRGMSLAARSRAESAWRESLVFDRLIGVYRDVGLLPSP